MAREYRNFSREQKIKVVKMILEDGKSQMEIERSILDKRNYKLNNMILHSDRGEMYKSGIYKTKTAEMNLKPSMSAPYTCTHNPWIETLNG